MLAHKILTGTKQFRTCNRTRDSFHNFSNETQLNMIWRSEKFKQSLIFQNAVVLSVWREPFKTNFCRLLKFNIVDANAITFSFMLSFVLNPRCEWNFSVINFTTLVGWTKYQSKVARFLMFLKFLDFRKFFIAFSYLVLTIKKSKVTGFFMFLLVFDFIKFLKALSFVVLTIKNFKITFFLVFLQVFYFIGASGSR